MLPQVVTVSFQAHYFVLDGVHNLLIESGLKAPGEGALYPLTVYSRAHGGKRPPCPRSPSSRWARMVSSNWRTMRRPVWAVAEAAPESMLLPPYR